MILQLAVIALYVSPTAKHGESAPVPPIRKVLAPYLLLAALPSSRIYRWIALLILNPRSTKDIPVFAVSSNTPVKPTLFCDVKYVGPYKSPVCPRTSDFLPIIFVCVGFVKFISVDIDKEPVDKEPVDNAPETGKSCFWCS